MQQYFQLKGLQFIDGDLSTNWLFSLDVISKEVKCRLSTHINAYYRYILEPEFEDSNPLLGDVPLKLTLIDETYGSDLQDYVSLPEEEINSTDFYNSIIESLQYESRINSVKVYGNSIRETSVSFRVGSDSLSINI